MRFEKGNKFSKGRPKGSLNVATKKHREAMRLLLNDSTTNLGGWLYEIGKTDPKLATELVIKLGQTCISKDTINKLSNKS